MGVKMVFVHILKCKNGHGITSVTKTEHDKVKARGGTYHCRACLSEMEHDESDVMSRDQFHTDVLDVYLKGAMRWLPVYEGGAS